MKKIDLPSFPSFRDYQCLADLLDYLTSAGRAYEFPRAASFRIALSRERSEDELIVIDGNYRIIEANDAVLVRHGKRQQEVIGQHYHYSLCELVNLIVMWLCGIMVLS